MKYLTIFAAYDSDSVIHKYVVFYLKKLNEISDVIFVSDCDFCDTELKKIKNYCMHCITQRHGEYDFGSYKRGFLYAKEKKLLSEYEKIIFCNDSVFGPFTSLKKILKKLDRLCSPVTGLFKYKKDVLQDEHLQSYFIVFDEKIVCSDWFYQFMVSITHHSNKENIIEQYEIGLSQLIKSYGYELIALFDSNTLSHCNEMSLPHFAPDRLVRKGFPFLKICLFKRCEQFFFTHKKCKTIINSIWWKYKTNYIYEYLNAYKIQIKYLPKFINNPVGNYGPFRDTMQISQTFIAEKNFLVAISVLFSTYMRKNNSFLSITIVENKTEILLFEDTISVLHFLDNNYTKIPIEVSLQKGVEYSLELYPVGTDEYNFITLNFSDKAYTVGDTFFNRKKQLKSCCIRYFFDVREK